MKILNFGSCNIDHVYSVPHFVGAGETLSSNGYSKFVGGKGLNQSIAIAKSGISVSHAGCIGEDGEMLKQTLSDSDVDISFLKTVSTPTGHAIIQVNEKGENCIIIYSGANSQITTEYIDDVLSNYSEGDIIVLQNEINNIEYIIDRAFSKKMIIVLNPSPFNEIMQKTDLSKISVLIVNEVEGYEFSGEKEPEKICSYFQNNHKNIKLVLTLGHRGAMYFDCNTGYSCFMPAFNVQVKDTTAAGDTFMGYFIYSLVNNLSPEQSLKLASAASALAVSKNGASASIPSYCEVEKALKTLKPYKQTQSDNEINIIIDYIKTNITDASLTDLSKILKYSTSYTAIKVKQLLGVSFTSLLQKERCKICGDMLKETDIPIEEIIELSGYKNGSFFRKKFKEEFGKSPYEYRAFYKKGNSK